MLSEILPRRMCNAGGGPGARQAAALPLSEQHRKAGSQAGAGDLWPLQWNGRKLNSSPGQSLLSWDPPLSLEPKPPNNGAGTLSLPTGTALQASGTSGPDLAVQPVSATDNG